MGRAVILAYAIVVISLGWSPWNVLLLVPLFSIESGRRSYLWPRDKSRHPDVHRRQRDASRLGARSPKGLLELGDGSCQDLAKHGVVATERGLREIRVNEEAVELNCRILLPAIEASQLRTKHLDFRNGEPVEHAIVRCSRALNFFSFLGGMKKAAFRPRSRRSDVDRVDTIGGSNRPVRALLTPTGQAGLNLDVRAPPRHSHADERASVSPNTGRFFYLTPTEYSA
jgi:hypothetical protein